ncbi:MAG: hypothetical protein M0038_14580 [Pseudomonadota bacterium]|jgi:transposase|nr:hypothetical protein [Pseudomonadota bacterium]
MPAKRSAMRDIKEVLRLKSRARPGHEQTPAATGLSKGALGKYVQRAGEQGLSWPLPEEFDDATLERRLFPQVLKLEQYTHADCAYVHHELKRDGVTPQLLWEECRAAQVEWTYRYSQFCWRSSAFFEGRARSMCQTRRAGENLFIDYSGDTVPVIISRLALPRGFG